MKLLADESVDRQIVDRLRQEGHTVWYVAEMEPGITDHSVLGIANNEGAVLLTADKDFGELIYRQRLVNPGVILIRLAGLAAEAKAQIVAKAINLHSSDLAHRFAVISHGALCIRHSK